MKRKSVKLAGLAVALLFLAAWYVPKISADRYREPIRVSLEATLGRKVEIGEVKFQLLPVPGFTIADVYIGEDPAVGPEPTFVKTVQGRPRISSLLGGAIEFASVDLEDASVNLTRAENGDAVRWNFSSLLRPKLPARFPSVHMIGGRVNFKFGDTKSVFYLLNTDVDLWPPSKADGPWTLRVHAEPARTDRPTKASRGFGSFAANGEWHPENGVVTLDVKLEKSELGDMVTLFEGKESYLHGHIRGEAHLSGPVSRVGLAGRVWVDDIHGWNQTPPGGGAWPISLGGAIDVPGQVIEIRATTEGRQSPLDVRYRVSNYLARPRWGLTVLFSQLPVGPLVGIARNLGLPIPDDVKLDGMAKGSVGFSMPDGLPRLDGAAQLEASTLAVAGAPPLQIPSANVRFAGSVVTLEPASVSNEGKESASLSGSYDTAERMLAITLSSDGMAVASLRPYVAGGGMPLLSLATAGMWSGQMRYSGVDGGWNGDIRLTGADIPFEGFAQPLHVLLAEAAIDGAALSIKRLSFTAGGIEGQGDYRYEPGAARPHRFRVSLGNVDGAALEKLLMPALHRGNFFNYALNFGKVPEPDWMRGMHADGTIQMAALDLGGKAFTALKTRVQWDADQVRLLGLAGNLQDAAFSGTVSVNLAQRQPKYDVAGKVVGFPWHAGTLGADGTLTTTGTGVDLVSNMKAEGKFRGRNIDLAPLDLWERIEGAFEWGWSGRNPRLKLGQLVMTTAGDTFQGSAETRGDGQLVLRATDGTRQIQALGAILQGEGFKPVGQ